MVVHWTALQVQALARRLGQTVVVVGFLPAQVALCSDVQTGCVNDFIREQPLQLAVANVFVSRIDAVLCGVLAKLVAKVPVVMQQRRSHDERSFPSLLREGGALQRVLKLSHVLAVVTMAVFAIGSEDFVEGFWVHGVRGERTWKLLCLRFSSLAHAHRYPRPASRGGECEAFIQPLQRQGWTYQ